MPAESFILAAAQVQPVYRDTETTIEKACS
jgi:hypothetical protein